MNSFTTRQARALSVVSALIIIFLLAGCGGDKKAQEQTSQNSSSKIDDGPAIDESTLLVDSVDTLSVDELGIPPRRFYSAPKALAYMKDSEHWPEYQEGILVRMVEENLPYADRLLNSRYDYFIVADKQSMHVALFDRYGRLVKQYPMACARNYGTKHRRNDCRTPEGFFFAQGIYDSTDWLYTDENGVTSPTRGVYGPRFIRVNAPVTSTTGIHGTGSPGSLGKRVSHGCMRVANESILDLVQYARPGMPIIVNPSDRDVVVNRNEGYDIPQIYTGLKPSATSRDLSDEVNRKYPARPSLPDSLKSAEPEILPDSIYIEEVEEGDSLLLPPEIVIFPDSITHQ